MKKLITIILILAGINLYAQNVSVSGVVVDQSGDPVVGAVVMVEGSTSGVMTDLDGKYKISVPSSAKKIVVSCLSYKKTEVALSQASRIVLEDDSEELEEVVVVGYGSMRRSDLTGSVTSIRMDEDKTSRSSTLDQLIDGRAAGVQLVSSNDGVPDAGISIRVRGISTFSSNLDPLYVVDGVIISGEAQSTVTLNDGTSAARETESANGLSGINPSDIASIEILKDASATAIYGSKGANGVVLITTKQAGKDIPVVNFNTGISITQPARRLDFMSFDQYVGMLTNYPDEATANDWLKRIYTDPVARDELKVVPIDWQDYVFRNGISQRYYLSVSGRPKGYNYLFSLGYNQLQGVVRESDSDNITVRLNLSKDIFKNFNVAYRVGIGYTKTNVKAGTVFGSADSFSSLIRSVSRTKPFRYAGDEYEDDEIGLNLYDQEYLYNPIRHYRDSYNTTERFRVNPSLTMEWKITKWLTFKSTMGADFTTSEKIKGKAERLSISLGNYASVGEDQQLRYNFDNMLLFNKKWRKHSLNATLGQSASRNMYMANSVVGKNLVQLRGWHKAINEATGSNAIYSLYSESQNSILSFFARSIYNYADRYVVTSTLRFDGSSKFRGVNKWGVFPSFAFAWRMTKEPWFHVPAISNLKLRAGWGQVGNQTISSYQTTQTYASTMLGNHFNETGKEGVIYPTNISNQQLKWETSSQIDAGIDISLWKGRLAITADYYRKNTYDLLQNKTISSSSGFQQMAVNDGKILNTGFEMTVDAVPLKYNGIEWLVGGNITVNRNRITSVGAGGAGATIYLTPDSDPITTKAFYGASLQTSYNTDPLNIFVEGQSLGLFYGYVCDGICQEGETAQTAPSKLPGVATETGYMKYKDLNGNGVIDPGDRCIIGCAMPKFTYGFNTSLSYKSFSMKISFVGSYGQQLYNFNNYFDYQVAANKNARMVAYEKAWTPENTESNWPKVGAIDYTFSDRYVEDASYLKISDLTFSYSLPLKKWNTKFLHGTQLSASVGNLALFTKYSGYTTLSNAGGNNLNRIGVDFNSVPFSRSFNFDVKFTF